jgi:hypothetical protein
VYKIINLFQLFANPYHDHGWQVWKIDPAAGSDLIGVFRTRAQARSAVAEWTVKQ